MSRSQKPRPPFTEEDLENMKALLPDANTYISDEYSFEFTCSKGKSYTITYYKIEVLNLDDDAPLEKNYEWFYFDWQENLNWKIYFNP
ncbi:hypothetical protein [Desertivirga arenae]|uniref:hypothetical protein n=1 Tax=Desertivirga arenae TaxID=2810309 RepID=UPI001A97550C|nr:hypothetical protein [Pedobacter sp. SYSU D00823]